MRENKDTVYCAILYNRLLYIVTRDSSVRTSSIRTIIRTIIRAPFIGNREMSDKLRNE